MVSRQTFDCFRKVKILFGKCKLLDQLIKRKKLQHHAGAVIREYQISFFLTNSFSFLNCSPVPEDYLQARRVDLHPNAELHWLL